MSKIHKIPNKKTVKVVLAILLIYFLSISSALIVSWNSTVMTPLEQYNVTQECLNRNLGVIKWKESNGLVQLVECCSPEEIGCEYKP